MSREESVSDTAPVEILIIVSLHDCVSSHSEVIEGGS